MLKLARDPTPLRQPRPTNRVFVGFWSAKLTSQREAPPFSSTGRVRVVCCVLCDGAVAFSAFVLHLLCSRLLLGSAPLGCCCVYVQVCPESEKGVGFDAQAPKGHFTTSTSFHHKHAGGRPLGSGVLGFVSKRCLPRNNWYFPTHGGGMLYMYVRWCRLCEALACPVYPREPWWHYKNANYVWTEQILSTLSVVLSALSFSFHPPPSRSLPP